jgi:hypothetical protein
MRPNGSNRAKTRDSNVKQAAKKPRLTGSVRNTANRQQINDGQMAPIKGYRGTMLYPLACQTLSLLAWRFFRPLLGLLQRKVRVKVRFWVRVWVTVRVR